MISSISSASRSDVAINLNVNANSRSATDLNNARVFGFIVTPAACFTARFAPSPATFATLTCVIASLPKSPPAEPCKPAESVDPTPPRSELKIFLPLFAAASPIPPPKPKSALSYATLSLNCNATGVKSFTDLSICDNLEPAPSLV